jgi:hypothetical protein
MNDFERIFHDHLDERSAVIRLHRSNSPGVVTLTYNMWPATRTFRIDAIEGTFSTEGRPPFVPGIPDSRDK